MCTRSSRAYTLIEMLAVIAIIGVLLGVAIFGFNAASRSGRLRGTIRSVTQHLSYARQLSITKRARHGVEFDLKAQPARFRIYRDSDGSRVTVGKWTDVPVGVVFRDVPNATGFEVEFTATGRAAGGLVSFLIEDAETGKHERIEVAAVTGHPSVVSEP